MMAEIVENVVAHPRSVAYGPTDGLLFLFPRWVEHMTYPNLREEERVSIAYNLAIAAKGR